MFQWHTNTVSAIQKKVEEYLATGVPLIWVVDPANQKVTVYRLLQDVKILSAEQELEGGEVLSGFRATIAQIFEL